MNEKTNYWLHYCGSCLDFLSSDIILSGFTYLELGKIKFMVVCGGGDLGRFTVSTMGGGTALDRVNKTQSLHKVLSSIH